MIPKPRFFEEKPLVILICTSAVFLTTAALFVLFSDLTPPLVLHFDDFYGVNFFGTVGDAWGLWLLGVVLTLVNAGLGEVLLFRERFLSFVLFATATLFSFLTLLTIGVIISVN